MSYCNKTVLVTGATGLIGSHIVDYFMDMGNVKVIASGRSEDKLRSGFKEYLNNSNFTVNQHDISEKLNIVENIDYIFHTAGPMEGEVIRNRPMDVINPNIQGTINCLEFLKKQKEETGINGRLILFSSVTVYGNNTSYDISVEESETRVTEVLNSVSAPYSQSKRLSEVIALAYLRQFGVDCVIARFSTVYGNTRFIPNTAFFEFIKKGVLGEDIVLNSSGLPRRDNIYIDDAVEGVVLVAEKGISGEAYNISSNGDKGNFASVDEIAKIIADVSDKKIKVIFKNATNDKRQPALKLNNAKLKQLGWKTKVSLNQGIEKTFENYKFMHKK